MTYSYPKVTYSDPRVTYSYPRVTYSYTKVTYRVLNLSLLSLIMQFISKQELILLEFPNYFKVAKFYLEFS